MTKKINRWVFVGLWFVILPLGLTVMTLSLVGAGHDALPEGLFGQLGWFVREQKVPSLIIFFTIFEAIIYGSRYSLPFADKVGVAGRPGLPKGSRRDFEAAGQLLDEVQQILRKFDIEIKKELPLKVREDLDRAMQALSEAMDAESFSISDFNHAHEHAAEMATVRLSRWQRSEVREYTESILIAVGVALLLRAFVVEAFKIPSGSMLPTLQISDHIFVNKFTYGPTIPFSNSRFLGDLPPKRGDVIVFEYPDEEESNPRQNFIKRAMAIPGDILETDGGHPIINGWKVPYCRVGHYSFDQETGYPKDGELFVEFLNDLSYLTLFEHYSDDEEPQREGPYVVQDGEFWVLGDNRNSSSDSRRWHQGRGAGVPFQNVKGRAMFVWLSFNDLGIDPLGVTWDRLLTNVMGEPRLPKEATPELKKGIQRCLAERPTNTRPPEPDQAKLEASLNTGKNR